VATLSLKSGGVEIAAKGFKGLVVEQGLDVQGVSVKFDTIGTNINPRCAYVTVGRDTNFTLEVEGPCVVRFEGRFNGVELTLAKGVQVNANSAVFDSVTIKKTAKDTVTPEQLHLAVYG
jgi:hypothetical protein